MSHQLTPIQIARLDQLEKIIEQDRHAFLRCGAAVLAVRDERLYLRDYSTFEAYCQGRWGWGVKRAHQLMKAAQFWESEKLLVDMGTKNDSAILQAKNESQARGAIKVLQSVELNDTTPSSTKQNLSKAPAKPVAPLDHTGTKIPNPALPFWERRDEVQPWLTAISHMKTTLEKK